MKTVKIKTLCGEIKGIDADTHLQFRGIEYAKASRWEYPEEVKKWDGVYDATEYGACSYQRRAFEEDEKCNAFYHKEFRKGLSFTYSEDCLFLNIWAPKDCKDAPVILYIHGGSFTGGSADEGHISGEEFAKSGVIFVAINYRLGPFGFCSHPFLADNKGRCGNYGLYDQYTAIKWVKNNIKAFGGDPDKITLLGQSAGAMSVDIQLSNPLCDGWFSGAVLMSGAALQRGLGKPKTPEKTQPFWEAVIKNAGFNTIEGLRGAEPGVLFNAWFKACEEEKGSMFCTLPVIDGEIITKDNFNMDTIPDIPYILGVTTADMVPAVLLRLVKRFENKASANGAPVYTYCFSRDLPGDDMGAWHSSDLLYAFSTLDFNWRPFDDTDRKISKEMNAMLCAFARSGNPNCKEIPEWNTGAKKPMTFSEDTKPKNWDKKLLIHNTIFAKKTF